MAIRVVVVCFSILHRTRSVSGHVSHHDRCRVGSVRVSDSVAKKPISASTDSRVYRRCLRAAPTPPSQKLILRGRRRTKLIRRRRWGRKRTVGISSVVSVPRKKSCSCVRSSSCTRSSWSASTTFTVGHGDSTLWTALLSSSLGYLLPNPSLKR